MHRATVVTPWAGAGTEADPLRARVGDDYPVAWSDLTGQAVEQLIPAPNAYTVAVVCDAATLAAIQADPDYAVLTSEEVVDGP